MLDVYFSFLTMKQLIITANPSSKSLTHELAKTYTTLSEAKGNTVEVLDLYTTSLRQDFLKYEDMKDMGKDEVTRTIQAKITEADELVFIFPIWWGDAPAILKNFIDSNFTAGFAFQYVNGKSVGMLTGKSARIIATSGAPSFFYKIILHIQLLWNMNRIGFCGMKQKSFTVFGDASSPKTDTKKYLEKLKHLV